MIDNDCLTWLAIIAKSLQARQLVMLLLVLLPVFQILAHTTRAFLTFIFIIFGHPFNQLATVPETLLFYEIELVTHIANSIFLSVAPESPVRLGAELPLVCSFAMSLIIFELARVFTGTIKPLELAIAVLLVLDPVTIVFYATRPRVNTVAIDMIILKLASIYATIRTAQNTLTFFLPLNVLADVARLVWECLLSLPVRVLINPVALVEGTIRVATYASTIHHVIDPLALVHRAVGVDVSAMALSLTSDPVAKIV